MLFRALSTNPLELPRIPSVARTRVNDSHTAVPTERALAQPDEPK